MGAWGYSFFHNDHDQDAISYYDVEAGLDNLENDDVEAVRAAGQKVYSSRERSPPEDDAEEIRYSLYALDCTDVERVRKHMDSGVLDELLAKKAAAAKTTSDDIPEPAYAYVLIAVCAMMLGCKIRSDVRQKLQTFHRQIARLPPDADEQLERALIGPDIYKSGLPHELYGPGPFEERESQMPRKQTPGGFFSLNVPCQYGFGPMPKRFTPRLVEDETLVARGAFGTNRCASCGVEKTEDGKVLMVCAKCKGSKYCDRVCQKAHWVLHKKTCKVLETEDVVVGDVQGTA